MMTFSVFQLLEEGWDLLIIYIYMDGWTENGLIDECTRHTAINGLIDKCTRHTTINGLIDKCTRCTAIVCIILSLSDLVVKLVRIRKRLKVVLVSLIVCLVVCTQAMW